MIFNAITVLPRPQGTSNMPPPVPCALKFALLDALLLALAT